MKERYLHRVWVLSHKTRNAEPVSFRAWPMAYFIQPYLVKVIRLQDISKTCAVTAFYSSK